jgi:hypothetical protein
MFSRLQRSAGPTDTKRKVKRDDHIWTFYNFHSSGFPILHVSKSKNKDDTTTTTTLPHHQESHKQPIDEI